MGDTGTSIHIFSKCFLEILSAFRYIVLFGNCMDPLKTMLDKIILEQFCTQEREDLPGSS